MKRYLFITVLSSFLVLCSCSDFLKETSQDEVRVETVKDFQELMINYMPYNCGFEYYYLFDDDIRFNERKFYGPSYIAEMYYGPFTWQPDMWQGKVLINNYYKSFYELIMGVNAVLDGIDDAEGDAGEREIVKAEALAMRGFYYFMLVNLYGQPYNYDKSAPGVPLKLESAITDNGIARNIVEEVYAQIVKDMETASAIFAQHPKKRGDFRINGTATDILLSRVYLYMEKYEKSIEAATRAIETSEGLTNLTSIPRGTKYFLPSYKHSEIELLYGSLYWNFELYPSIDLIESYDPADARRSLWFRSDGSVQRFRTESGDGPNLTIRISEAYLNRAEAYLLQSQVDVASALKDLVLLRMCRINNYEEEDFTDPLELLSEVRTERRRELCLDGHRWFDLRRYGMPSITHEYKIDRPDPWKVFTLEEKDPAYTLPIPDLMLENNQQLEQNPSRFRPAREGIIMN